MQDYLDPAQALPPFEDLGPKMQELRTDQQRLFCWHYMVCGKVELAAINSGYNPNSAAVQGRRLLARPDIKEALRECSWSKLHSSAMQAILALEDVVSDPTHKDRLKAADMILSRVGFLAKTGTEVQVQHSMDQKQVDAAILKLSAELGIDGQKLLGSRGNFKTQLTNVVEAEILEEDDLSDLLG